MNASPLNCGTGIPAATDSKSANNPATAAATPASTETRKSTGGGKDTGAMATPNTNTPRPTITTANICTINTINTVSDEKGGAMDSGNIYKSVEIPSLTDTDWWLLSSEYIKDSSDIDIDINTSTTTATKDTKTKTKTKIETENKEQDKKKDTENWDIDIDIDTEKLLTSFIMATSAESPTQINWNNPPVTKRYTPPSHEKSATAIRSMLDAAAAVAPSPSLASAAAWSPVDVEGDDEGIEGGRPASVFGRANLGGMSRSMNSRRGSTRSRGQGRRRSMGLQKQGGVIEQVEHAPEREQEAVNIPENANSSATRTSTTEVPATRTTGDTRATTITVTSALAEEEGDYDDNEDHLHHTTEESTHMSPPERHETFSSLEPPMSYNQNKARLFLAIYHRNEISVGTTRDMLGVNAFQWAFIYASKDFRRCYKLYAPSGIPSNPPLTDAVSLSHEPIRPEEIIAESIRGPPSEGNFLGLVLLSKVSVDVPLERIIDEILKVHLSTSSSSSNNSGAIQPHTPATWTWAAVKRLRRMNRSLVPNAVDDLESRALRFADKRMRNVIGRAKRQRTHWILNITDLGKPVASPADLGDTWQKVLTKCVGEEVTLRVQRRMRRMGLTRKER